MEGSAQLVATLAGHINARAVMLAKYRDYYLGKQEIIFAGEKLQKGFGEKLAALSCNRCGNVCDAIADRLQIEGFVDDAGKASTAANDLWIANGMDISHGEVHIESLIAGDGYVIVWPDMTTGEPILFPNYADRMAVACKEENPRELEAALKVWRQRSGKIRANLYTTTHLEKWVTKSAAEEPPEDAESWERFEEEGDTAWPIPYLGNYAQGRVPVFHFGNNARMGEYGISELASIIPLQDRLNQTLATLAVAEEHQSFRQRWATGIQQVKDAEGKTVSPWIGGPGQLWATSSKEAQFGDFEAADLGQFNETAEGWELRIARTARIPIHYLLGGENAPSGEMLKTAEGPFVAKIADRQRERGATWADCMEYALRAKSGTEANLSPVWKSAESRSDNDFWRNAGLRRDRGVSDQQILREFGYTDEEIEKMLEEIAEKGDAMGEAMARAFNRETSLGGEEEGEDIDELDAQEVSADDAA